MKTAIVIGATGLVGSQLVSLLLQDSRFERVKVFARRSVGVTSEKLEEHIVDFDQLDSWKRELTGDVLYSAMGTTLRTAGSKEAQYKIDYTYQYQVAKAAVANGVPQYILVSSAGASVDSRIFYSRMKGELERDIKKLPFEVIHVVRPGMLAGSRIESRAGEKVGIVMMKLVGAIPGLNALRPIQGREVAQAMINATFKRPEGIHSYSLGEVFKLAKQL